MEFLVEFEVNVPDDALAGEVEARQSAEARAAARLTDEGHLVRLWKAPTTRGGIRALGLYRADSEAQLGGLLDALPLYDWMNITVTPLETHPNDPVSPPSASVAASSEQ
jgi:muconolactone D-isomerase